MDKLISVRGTRDLFRDEMEQFSLVVEIARRVSVNYGFEEIATPVLEYANLFTQLGESSDIVSKEIYSFVDKGENLLALRPEFTAGVARAFISGGLQQYLPLRLFSVGPLFRRERPQKGRYRQFHQINFECLGYENPACDAEIITLAHDLIKKRYGLSDIILDINSIGDIESRAAYKSKLLAYLSKYEGELSADSKIRLKKNPLRILDSKDKTDRKILADAPHIIDSLNNQSKQHYDTLLRLLSDQNIDYRQNHYLVRGMDYYTDTVFEFVPPSHETQGTLLAGGRYNNLIKSMGGRDTPAFGFAAGIERLGEMIRDKNPSLLHKTQKKAAIIPIGDGSMTEGHALGRKLRNDDISVIILLEGHVTKRLKKSSCCRCLSFHNHRRYRA